VGYIAGVVPPLGRHVSPRKIIPMLERLLGVLGHPRPSGVI
jgi:hypothetical protein